MCKYLYAYTVYKLEELRKNGNNFRTREKRQL